MTAEAARLHHAAQRCGTAWSLKARGERTDAGIGVLMNPPRAMRRDSPPARSALACRNSAGGSAQTCRSITGGMFPAPSEPKPPRRKF